MRTGIPDFLCEWFDNGVNVRASESHILSGMRDDFVKYNVSAAEREVGKLEVVKWATALPHEPGRWQGIQKGG